MADLRPLSPRDIPAVLDLNAAHTPEVSAMDRQRLDYLAGLAHRFAVVDVAGEVAGFVVTVAAGTGYDSANYRWFADRYGAGFHYLDRIVVAAAHRRAGLASMVYERVEADAAAAGTLALEVNVVPRNNASLAFHARRGFVEVGSRGDAAHRVVMLAKVLPGAAGPHGRTR